MLARSARRRQGRIWLLYSTALVVAVIFSSLLQQFEGWREGQYSESHGREERRRFQLLQSMILLCSVGIELPIRCFGWEGPRRNVSGAVVDST